MGKSYKLSGITELANLLDIDLLVDRGYPLYNYYPDNTAMITENKNTLPNYSKFIEERDKLGQKTEMFEVGSNTQFVLKNNPRAYPDFEIRNVCGNGMVWTGSGNSTKIVYPSNSFKAGGENREQYEDRLSEQQLQGWRRKQCKLRFRDEVRQVRLLQLR